MLGINSLQSQNLGLILFFAIVFIFVTILLFISIKKLIKQERNNSTPHKIKYKEINGAEQEEHFRDNATEHITLNHPDYIGFLTKIDKKRIAEEYLESLKKEKKYEKNN
jgi:hypothetical protein